MPYLNVPTIRTFCIAMVVMLSASLNFYGIDWPYGVGFHYDETTKARFVLSGHQDFKHPILMLQIARIANLIFQLDAEQAVAHLGRFLSAAYASVIVLISFFLARHVTSVSAALLTAYIAAVSPILVVHAHYFKEDMLQSMCMLLSLVCFLRFCEHPSIPSSAALGLVSGLAMSAKYPSVLLVGLYIVAPWLERGVDRQRYYMLLAISGIVCGDVFLLVNWPLMSDILTFQKGVYFEFNHALTGHTLRTYAGPYGFCFHLMYSLVPGLTLPLTITAVTGLLMCVWNWRVISWKNRLLCCYAVGYYLVMESSPCKPEPDFMRYMLPIVPVLAAFAAQAIAHATQAISQFSLGAVAVSLVAVVLLVPLVDSVLIDYYLLDDTRVRAARWIEKTQSQALFECYAGSRRDLHSVTEVDARQANANGVAYLVASSFWYDRYYRGSRMKGQSDEVYRIHQRYEALFRQYSYIEFRPRWRSVGFNNPIVRVIDIRNPKVDDATVRPSGLQE